nr:unnamed protein product [Digitaria exilis]
MAAPPQPQPPAAEQGAAPAAPLPAGAPPGPRPYEVAVAAAELRPVDCNLAALCDHVQAEGFGSGAFSDVVVEAMGATYRLHRLILSRSAYFRNMLHGPWREAGAPTVVLHIDDANVDSEAIAIALAYLYGQPPKLNDNNAFRVLAAASFLDLQDLCTICTDFIISELWTSNFLQYQASNYCLLRVKIMVVMENVSETPAGVIFVKVPQWNYERFELALFTLLAKVTVYELQVSGNETSSSNADRSMRKGKTPMNEPSEEQLIKSELQNLKLHDNLGSEIAHNTIAISDMNLDSLAKLSMMVFGYRCFCVTECKRLLLILADTVALRVTLVLASKHMWGDGNGVLGPVRVNVRGAVDGLAGIGRGNSNVPGAAWAPTRYVFSRVPYGLGSRNGQQFANDESEPRIDRNGDISADGLTALVNLSQENNAAHQQAESIFETDTQTRYRSVASVSTPGGSSVQMQESKEHELGSDWETADDATISLDMKTPLSHFPPFRFGVEFEEVHRLADGQVKHSTEVFYAGSLWKVSVQAFNDEDPHGRRTLGLFLHRRKAEFVDPLRKAYMYVDPREKVTARYQLICPSKREVMVFGSLKQAGTLLPKAPKGWGWRTAILFDELADLLQGGALRIAAVVQLV